MDKIKQLIEELRAKFEIYFNEIRKKAFGANNENLDFFVDSFNRLDAKQKMMAAAGGLFVILLGIIFVFWFYFSSVDALRTEMSRSFQAIQEMQSLQSQLEQEERRFDTLADKIQGKVSNLRVKPYFETLSKKIGIVIDDIDDKSSIIDSSDPLSKKFENLSIDLRLSKISIPRLLNFIAEFEKSDQLMRLQDLTIRARYGTKLYFDASLKIVGYQLSGG